MSKYPSIILFTFFFQLIQLETSGQNWNFGVQSSSIVSMQRFVIEPPQHDEIKDYYGPLLSFSFNGYINFRIYEKWSVSLEPGFIRKGEIGTSDPVDPNDDIKLLFDYSQFPILGHYNIFKKLFIIAGPELSYLHRVKAKSNELVNDISSFYYNHLDISGTLGVGYKILEYLEIELRYNHSFNSYQEILLTNIDGDILANITRYNQYAQLLLRFKI